MNDFSTLTGPPAAQAPKVSSDAPSPNAVLVTGEELPLLRAAYSDRTAALMAELAAYAYEDLAPFEIAEGRGTSIAAPARLADLGFEQLISFHNGLDDGWAYVAESKNMIAIVFRGTKSEKNWQTNFRAIQVRPDKNNSLLKVHSGFFAAYQLLSNGEKTAPAIKGQDDKKSVGRFIARTIDVIRIVFDDILNSNNDVDAKQFTPKQKTSEGLGAYVSKLKEDTKGAVPIYLTGHSLGGALAQIAAAELGDDQVAACYTFGSPRVGNMYFDLWVKPPSYRVVNYADIVPQVPLPIGYRHSGDARYLPATVTATPFRFSPNILQRFAQLLAGIKQLFIHKSILGIDDHNINLYADKLLSVASARTQNR